MTRPLQPERAPRWMRPLLDGLRTAQPADLSHHRIPTPTGARRSAVLILVGDDDERGPDVLLTERASTLRAHAGQVSFPGGSADPGDGDAVATALLDGLRTAQPADLSHHRIPTPTGARRSAVLILVGDDERGPDVLLTERASTLRAHAGQVSFPGGSADPGDADAVATALREAEEETGLAPSGVVPLLLLPDLYIPPTGYVVTPVVAHWADPSAVHSVDPAETAAVVRVPLAALADPHNRLLVRHPSGYVGPAFVVAGLVVWGFTGGLLAALLHLGGWERPWDSARVRDLDEAWAAARAGGQEVAET